MHAAAARREGRRNGTGWDTHFREVVIRRQSKNSSSGSAFDGGAASIDHAALGRVDGVSGGVMRPQPVAPSSTLSMRLLPRAGVAQMSRAHSLARLDCRSCSAAGWAETRTPLRHRRDTSQIPPAARAPPSSATFLKPHETASAPRAHPPASARGQTTRALPWEDATARFLQLGFEVARRPVRARELFPYSPP